MPILYEFQNLQAVITDEVGLHKEIEQAGIEGKSTTSWNNPGSIYEPSSMYAALNQAGVLLRENPYLALAQRSLETPSDLHPEDVVTHALLQVINASIDTSTEKTSCEISPQRSITSPPMTIGHACSEAEFYFAATVLQMNYKEPLWNDALGAEQLGFQIVTDEQTKEPIAIRKGASWPTLLTLETIIVNGIPYPPGSIMRADMPYEKDGPVYRSSYDFSKQEYIHLSSIDRLGFLRLSAFALKPELRGRESNGTIYTSKSSDITASQYAGDSLTILHYWTLSQIKELATITLNTLMHARY